LANNVVARLASCLAARGLSPILPDQLRDERSACQMPAARLPFPRFGPTAMAQTAQSTARRFLFCYKGERARASLVPGSYAFAAGVRVYSARKV